MTKLRIFKIFGLTNNQIAERIDEISHLLKKNIEIQIDGNNCDSKLFLQINCQTAAEADKYTEVVKEAFADNLYAETDTTLADRAAELLINSGVKISLAESFTCGGLGYALSHYPGISSCFMESIVCYSFDSKMQRLGVKQETLDKFGPVSEETVREMAEGLIKTKLPDLVVATTGNAGPSKQNDKVGVFYIASGFKNNINVRRVDFYSIFDNEDPIRNRRLITEFGINYALLDIIKLLDTKKTKKK